mmetsp:Transcript_95302/g.269697  ORF Transcript_95302/g.269697 Transcript_95302/m.269697 type:complete len:267 (+) Transcript_95302:242-1042(+)
MSDTIPTSVLTLSPGPITAPKRPTAFGHSWTTTAGVVRPTRRVVKSIEPGACRRCLTATHTSVSSRGIMKLAMLLSSMAAADGFLLKSAIAFGSSPFAASEERSAASDAAWRQANSGGVPVVASRARDGSSSSSSSGGGAAATSPATRRGRRSAGRSWAVPLAAFQSLSIAGRRQAPKSSTGTANTRHCAIGGAFKPAYQDWATIASDRAVRPVSIMIAWAVAKASADSRALSTTRPKVSSVPALLAAFFCPSPMPFSSAPMGPSG